MTEARRCMRGAWGSDGHCLTHTGLPIGPSGLCIEGHALAGQCKACGQKRPLGHLLGDGLCEPCFEQIRSGAIPYPRVPA